MTKNTLLFTAFTALLFISCNNNTSEPDNYKEPDVLSSVLMPLEAGYEWKYKWYDLNSDGSLGDEIPLYAFNMTIKDTSYDPEHIYKEKVYHAVYYYPYTGYETKYAWFYRNYKDGLYLMGGNNQGDTLYTKLLYYKYPVQKGDTWLSPHLVFVYYDWQYYIADSVKYTCTDTNAVFETPLGSFKCFVFYHREKQEEDVVEQLDIYDYYAPNVGLVGRIINSYYEYENKSYPKYKQMLYSTNVKY